MGKTVKVDGLVDLVKVLKGREFRDVNFALREHSRTIADSMAPHIALAVRLSAAPQARAMSATIRTKRDRVPVVIIGGVNPKFSTEKRFTRKGSDSKRRRGSIAHGVIFGPQGGKRSTSASENYYRIGRNDDGGALGRSLRDGPAMKRAEVAYLKAYIDVLTAAGLAAKAGTVR